MVKITGTYEGELHCTARHEPSGNTLVTDAPRDNQGRGEAFSPTDLVATAFATCIATTMAIMARKHGHELGALRYEVTKEMTATPPRSIARLAATIWLPASARRPGTTTGDARRISQTPTAASSSFSSDSRPDQRVARMIQAPPRSPTFSKPCRSYSASAGLSGSTLRLTPV